MKINVQNVNQCRLIPVELCENCRETMKPPQLKSYQFFSLRCGIAEYQNIISTVRFWDFHIIMILWYYHDISKYQAPQHLITSRQTFEIIVILSLRCGIAEYQNIISTVRFWDFHIIVILSWYIKISSPSTLDHIHFSMPSQGEILILDIVILSWYIKLSNPWTLTSQILANISDYDIYIAIFVLSWYIKISSSSTLSHI